jgi:hypothetical protein
MAEISSPVAFGSLGGRAFAFYPAIRNAEYNQWTYLRETWSEVLVANAKTSEEVWIPRHFLGRISSADQPVPIIGLTRELELKAGAVWPYQRQVISMPSPPRAGGEVPRPPSPAAPSESAPTPPLSTDSQMGRLIGYALLFGLGLCLLAVVIARQGVPQPQNWFRTRDVATRDQQYLSLTREDNRHTIARKMGPPDQEQWITPESAEIHFNLMWYPERSYIIVLMGPDRASARYIGAIHASSRVPLDSVPLPGGGSTASMLRTLPKF